jgi:hypothetical protein
LRRRAARRTHGACAAGCPLQAIHAYGLAPYFLYGLLYFSFLFLDRMLAWTVAGSPCPSGSSAGYEVGWTSRWSSSSSCCPQLEYAVHAFADSMTPVQTSYLAAQAQQHNTTTCASTSASSLLLVAMGAGAAGARDGRGPRPGDVGQLPATVGLTWSVFLCGALGYALLVVALLNGVFLFSLSRPWPAVGGCRWPADQRRVGGC